MCLSVFVCAHACVRVCVVWRRAAEGVTVSYERVSAGEKQRVRGQVLPLLERIDRPPTGRPKEH